MTQPLDKTVVKKNNYTPLAKIIKTLKKTGSVSDAAKILNLSRQAIYQRLEANNIDKNDFLDFSDDKGLTHEILQYRIARGLTPDDIKKMPGGSKVLAICQLDDKIRAHRGENENKNSISVVLHLACNSHNGIKDITPSKTPAIVENSVPQAVDK